MLTLQIFQCALCEYSYFHLGRVHVLNSVKHSPIMIPVSITSEEDAMLRQYIKYSLFPSRVHLITFEVSVPSFPINTLRSIAIRSCQTTHVLITTPYAIPSSTPWLHITCSRPLQLPFHHPRNPSQRSSPSSHRPHVSSGLLHRSLRYLVQLQRLVGRSLRCFLFRVSYFGSINKRFLYHYINWGSCKALYQTPRYVGFSR